jgi:hypothetical protein
MAENRVPKHYPQPAKLEVVKEDPGPRRDFFFSKQQTRFKLSISSKPFILNTYE